MSLEECGEKDMEKAARGRVASGIALGERITLVESRCIIGLPFPPCMGSLRTYGESSPKYFYHRKSADKFFDELVKRYGLKEAEGQ